MEYRRLGRSGLEVSPICLGTMTFGDRTDATEAAAIVATAREAGINFIDTADVYAEGESERIVGRLIGAERPAWVLATKAANRMGEGPNRSGLSRAWLMQAIEGSLHRLATDYVDLFYFHHEDHETPLEESVGAVGDLIHGGKVRYWGLSNHRGWKIAEAVRVARGLGVPDPVACQPYYNAMNRQPEVEVIPACVHYGLGVVPYSPLARGVLTGKYGRGNEPPAESRAGRRDVRIMQTEFRPESLAMAHEIKAHTETRGMSAGQFALNWVLNNRAVASVLAGPRTRDQWTEYLDALQHRFSPADEALIERLVKPGHPSTPGYSDPRYPVAGRYPIQSSTPEE